MSEMCRNCCPCFYEHARALASIAAGLGPPHKAVVQCEWPVYVQEGNKPIYHLEAFVAKLMSEYKQWTVTAFGS